MAKDLTSGKTDKSASATRTTVRKSRKTAKDVNQDDIRKEIEQRAHEIYLARREKGDPGDPQHDWLAAEAEIRTKYQL